ncbi:MAG: DUF58 domain-containing protein [Oscillospiraceae bacterium]|nr:DUF58 domain-containing protein [Oscillospiraceae bacterium]
MALPRKSDRAAADSTGRAGSGLASPIGLVILAALILAAAYMEIPVMEVFLTAIFLLCLIAYLWARFALRGIEIKTEGGDCAAFPGETPEVRAELLNRKLLPLVWLDVDFVTERGQCVDAEDPDPDDEAPTVGSGFAWIMPHQRLRWPQRARAVRRGVCEVADVRLTSGDGFGLSSLRCRAPLAAPLRYVVYPAVIPVDETVIMNNMSEMEKSSQGFYTDMTLVKSTRPYAAGDSARDINWRLLARTDEVQVNVREKLNMCRVCFAPDIASCTHIERKSTDEGVADVVIVERDKLERMLSAIASLIIKLHEREVLCALALPSVGSARGRVVVPDERETQTPLLLTALAEVKYSGEQMDFPWDDMDAARRSLGQMFLLTASADSAARDALRGFDDFSAIRIIGEGPPELPERMYRKEELGIK